MAFLRIESLPFGQDTIPLRWARNESNRNRGGVQERQTAATVLPQYAALAHQSLPHLTAHGPGKLPPLAAFSPGFCCSNPYPT
jgi:hypothetical protein